MNNNQESVKAGLVAIALIGNIAIGFIFADARMIALTNCGVAIGGYLGQLTPKKEEK